MGGSHWPAAVAAATAGRDWPPAAWRGANDRLFGAGHRRGQGVVHRPPYVAVAAGHTARAVVRARLRQCLVELDVACRVHVGRIAGVVHRDAGRRS